jgi:hypothetical protein
MQADGTTKLAGARTEITGNALAGLGKESVSGLYLNELLVGSANTLLTEPHGYIGNYKSYITDSAAAGTALDRHPAAGAIECYLAGLQGQHTVIFKQYDAFRRSPAGKRFMFFFTKRFFR